MHFLAFSQVSVKIKIAFYFTSMHLWCRYLKRGVNEKGRVANDVETEQQLVNSWGIILILLDQTPLAAKLQMCWDNWEKWLHMY